MKENSAKVRVKLDWGRLLGFDQAPAPDCGSDPVRRRARLARMGGKVGTKRGVKAT